MKILLLGFAQKEKTSYAVKRLLQELKKRGHEVNYVLWRELVFSFNAEGVVIKKINGRDLKYYDYIIPRSPLSLSIGDDKSISASEKRRSRTYLSHLYRHYLLIVDYVNQYHTHVLNEKTAKKMPFYDKLFQYFLLAKHGLPVVPSVLYTGQRLPDSVYKRFSFPYIAKSIEGSRGKQILQIKKVEDITPLIEEFGLGKVLVQKFLKINHDYRIIVLNNKVIGGMKRTAPPGDFRANVSVGGTTERIKVNYEFRDLALKAAKIFGAEFAGVDIIKYKGRSYILELNIFPGFAGFEEATKVNVAEKIAAYVEKKYLWSINRYDTTKERLRFLEILYPIERENFNGYLTKKRFKEELKNNHLILVQKEYRPIAYLTYNRRGNVLYISRLVILPKYMGQRIGRRMLKYLIALAKKEQALKVSALVAATNERRQQSMRRAGFKKMRVIGGKYFKGTVDGYEFEYKIPRVKQIKNAGRARKATK